MASPYPTFGLRNDAITTTTSKTVAATDAGSVQNYVPSSANVGQACVFTLPAAAAGNVGLSFTFRAGGNNGDSPVTVTPNAADGVNGLGFTSATGKGPQVLAAVQKAGDEITVTSSGVTGVNAWYISNVIGTWTRLP
jgi:hypothetical protein